MKCLLLTVLVCLVSATEELLPFSGNFTTIYLASKNVRDTGENSKFRMLMREVNFYKNYTLMSMTFYIRRNGKCQLHTVWVDKSPLKFCPMIASSDLAKCFKNSEKEFIVGTWVIYDPTRHVCQINTHPEIERRRSRIPAFILIHFVSNTTIVLEAHYINDLRNPHILTAALAKGPNITEEMWKEYVNLTRYYEIPIENIKNVYEADACPK